MKGRRLMRVRILALLLVAALPLGAIFTFELAGSHDDARARQHLSRQALAASLARGLDATIDGSFAVLRSMALDPTLRDRAAHGRAAEHLRAHRAAQPAFQGIGLYDAKGDVLAHTDRDPYSFTITDRDYFPVALAGREFAGRVIVGRGTGVRTIPLAVPVAFTDGTRGLLVAPLALTAIERDVAEIARARGAAYALIDREGSVFLHSDPALAEATPSLRGRPDADAVLRGETGTVLLGSGDAAQLAAFAPVPSAEWGLLLAQPAAAAFATANESLQNGLALLGLALIAMLVVGWVLGTRLAEAYERADAERAFLAHLIEVAPMAIAVVEGHEHRYVAANPRYQAFAPDVPMVGRRYDEVWPEDVLRTFLPVLARVLATGEPFVATDAPSTIPRADGTPETRYFSAAMTRYESPGRPAGVVIAALETTDVVLARERTAAERERNAREREAFVGVASHELKTPLTAVMLASQVLGNTLRRRGVVDAQVDRQLTVLSQQVQRAARLVSELLDMSRLQSGQLEVRREPVDVAALVRDAVERTRDSLPADRAVLFDLRGADDALFVLADEARLDQVLTNVLSNAAKYGHAGGVVEVTLERDDARARLSVIDHGIGIAATERERLFTPFGRTRDAQASGIEGHGLGLYISSRLMAAMGGTLSASDTPGGGATFTVELDAARTVAELPPAEATTARA